MKKFFTCLLLLFSGFIFAQQKFDLQIPKKFNLAWIKPLPKADQIEGILYSALDSSLMILPDIRTSGIGQMIATPYKIKVDQINVLKIRSNKRKKRTMLISLGVGAAATTAVSIAAFTSPGTSSSEGKQASAAFITVGVGFAFIGMSAIIGSIIGSAKKKFRIHGDQEKYAWFREEINRLAMKPAQGK